MLRRHLGATAPPTLAPRRLDETRGIVARRVAEDAAGVRHLERLRRVAAIDTFSKFCLDLTRIARREDHLSRADDRAAIERRPPIRKLRSCERLELLAGDDDLDAIDDIADLDVGAGVHSNGAADGPRNADKSFDAGKPVLRRLTA